MEHPTRARAANIGPFSFSLRVSPHTAQHVHRPSKLPASRSVTGEMPQISDMFLLFMCRPMQPHTASHAPRQVACIPVCDWWSITHEHALQTTDLFPRSSCFTPPRTATRAPLQDASSQCCLTGRSPGWTLLRASPPSKAQVAACHAQPVSPVAWRRDLAGTAAFAEGNRTRGTRG